MNLLFLSEYYNHHLAPICRIWDARDDCAFRFASTAALPHEREMLGWPVLTPPFVTCYAADDATLAAQIAQADVVLFGGVPLKLLAERLKSGKPVFKYSERIFRRGYRPLKWLPRVVRYWYFYGRHKHLYLLCAGAYTAADFARHGTFRTRRYKWGYFPETRRYDLDALLSGKNPKRILWCGRFLPLKHPDDALQAAERLMHEGVNFELEMIGSGPMEAQLRAEIAARGLSERVHMLGAMPTDAVRTRMEQAGIFLFTSDFSEGWGVVLNEAMNGGCAAVASHAIGAVPYLLKHGQNGLIYRNGNLDALTDRLRTLLCDPSMQRRFGRQAYETITQLWNAEVAAERFVTLAAHLVNHARCDLFDDGPCSRADVLPNDWFREENT